MSSSAIKSASGTSHYTLITLIEFWSISNTHDNYQIEPICFIDTHAYYTFVIFRLKTKTDWNRLRSMQFHFSMTFRGTTKKIWKIDWFVTWNFKRCWRDNIVFTIFVLTSLREFAARHGGNLILLEITLAFVQISTGEAYISHTEHFSRAVSLCNKMLA